MRILPAFAIVSAALLLAACADSIVSECDTPAQPPMRARLAEIEQRLFAQSCALAGCHAGSSPAAGMDLSPGRAYASLVGVGSLNHPGQLRVEAGNSARSVLVGVLRRELAPAMPPSGPIDAAIIDSIAAWIDNGALND